MGHIVISHAEIRELIPRMDETALVTLGEIAEAQGDSEVVADTERELERRERCIGIFR